jgi:hypothetical protein
LQDGILTEEAAKQLQLTESSFVNRTYILDMLQRMRELCKKNETFAILCTSEKSVFFTLFQKKKCALGKTPLLPLGHAHSISEDIARRRLDFEMLKRVDRKLR